MRAKKEKYVSYSIFQDLEDVQSPLRARTKAIIFLLPKKILSVEGCLKRRRRRREVSRGFLGRPGFSQWAFWGLPTSDLACTLGVPLVYLRELPEPSARISRVCPPMTAQIECLRSDMVLSESKCVSKSVVLLTETHSLGSTLPVRVRRRPPSPSGMKKERIPKGPTNFCTALN